ncbi:glycosyltransferase family 2 protein [Sediminibacillus massiliensis]|uniref:glycosyltransferase family 2 protein n=1 Tax=Sediminibacillus massiliensis TaxID=1926277 RepID=UPI0009883307|nr:glycosyltransferase family 2 protein [Sediminibacillus massiliensis]
MNPFISVIVPVYNVEKHLSRCIESLLKQTYTHFEILLVNDGSTDKSGDICNYYKLKSNKIRVFHMSNKGVSSARNYGIEKCKGEYIQFVDSDDFVNETYISSMVNIIKDRSIDLVISGINQVESSNGKIKQVKEIVSKVSGFYKKPELKDIMPDLIESSYINYCYSKLIKRNLITKKQIRFDENISLGEDTLFVLEIIKASNKIYILSTAEYNYLNHSDDTLTYKIRQDKFYILNKLYSALLNFCQTEGYYTPSTKYSLERRYLETIRFCLDENFKLVGSLNFLKGLRNISNILNNKDVCNYFNDNKTLFNNYPKMLINAIRSKSSVRYSCIYYLLIINRKLRSLL